MTEWLVGWLVVCVNSWLVDRQIEKLVYWVIGQLSKLFIWLIGEWVDEFNSHACWSEHTNTQPWDAKLIAATFLWHLRETRPGSTSSQSKSIGPLSSVVPSVDARDKHLNQHKKYTSARKWIQTNDPDANITEQSSFDGFRKNMEILYKIRQPSSKLSNHVL